MQTRALALTIFLALVILTPDALAQNSGNCLPPSLCVRTEERSSAALDGQTSLVWSFTATPGFFNFTAVSGTNYNNDSLTRVYLRGDQAQSVSDTVVYQWQVNIADNLTTHHVKAQVTYERKGWFAGFDFTPHGNAYYSIIEDGREIYSFQRIGFDWNANPLPSFTFDMDLHPTKGNLSIFQQNGNTTSAANTYLGATFPSLKIDDAYGGQSQTNELALSDWNPFANRGQAEVFLTDITQVSALPTLEMATNRPTERQVLSFEFGRYASKLSVLATGAGVSSCSFNIDFGLFHFCISALLDTVWSFIIGAVSFPISFILGIIPGLSGIKNALLSVVATVFGYFRIVTSLLFGSGPNYPVGGAFVAVVALTSMISFPIWAMTGSISFLWRFPTLFVKWLIKGTVLFGKFILFDIPIAIYSMFAGMIP